MSKKTLPPVPSVAPTQWMKPSGKVFNPLPELVHKEVYSTWTHVMGPNTFKEAHGFKEDGI